MFVDPLAEETMEPYLYTGNNPIMFTDPTGMSKEGKYFGYNQNIRSTGSHTYYRSTTHSGSSRGYKTNYSKGFLPGSTQRSHNHLYATQKNSFKGTNVEMTTTTNSKNLGLVGYLSNVAPLHKISETISVTTTNVKGQYYDRNGNKVDSIRDASSLVVSSNIIIETGNISNNSLPDNIERTEINSMTSYDVKFNNGYELINESKKSVKNDYQVSIQSSSKDFMDSAVEAIKTNVEVRNENFDNAKKAIEKAIDISGGK